MSEKRMRTLTTTRSRAASQSWHPRTTKHVIQFWYKSSSRTIKQSRINQRTSNYETILWSIFGQFIAPNSWRSTISIHALSSQFSVQQSSSTKLIEFVGAADVEVREASAVAGGRGGFRWRWCGLPWCYACGIKVVQQSTISYLRWLNLVCKLFCIWP